MSDIAPAQHRAPQAAKQNHRAPAPTPIEPSPRKYDTALIADFLDMIFHAAPPEGAEVLTWAVKKGRHPIYPDTEENLLNYLDRTTLAKALYFGTATVKPDSAGKLYNRQALFESLHVLVLDDIGTKGGALPELLQRPTYIMETSKDNYQYGYVLDVPLTNFAAARALVQIMYEAGIADAGGKLPNKLVRLPEGVNGKAGVKENFITTLTATDGPLWTPQELLDAVDSGATWDEIETDADLVMKQRNRLRAGTTPWAPFKPLYASMAGVIDPVMEWLAEEDQVVTETGDWVTIKCPRADEHSSGDGTAGYKPLGVGEQPESRAFHCFHDACSTFKTFEFLQHITTLDGPAVGVRDIAAGMVSTYAYDTINDCAWKIKDTITPRQISISGLKNTYPRSVRVGTAEGKIRSVSEFSQWLTSESRVTVMGPMFDPNTDARIVERDGDLYINQYAPPPWGAGAYDEGEVDKFKHFIDYLIPDADEQHYFLDWLAAKCQNMGFRGAAIVMVAQAQGVGRSTLADMISVLLGVDNVRNEPFENIVGGGEFNEWLEYPFIVSDETLNSGGLGTYTAYEKLKELIDPRPRLMMINPKFGKKRRTMVHSSFLFLSNHSNALATPQGDRRIYVVTNPFTPKPPSYFTALNAWLDKTDANGKPQWAAHVYRWLMQREVDMEAMLAPPETTVGKAAMLSESKGALDLVVESVLEHWPCEFVANKQIVTAVESFATRIELYDTPNYAARIKRIVAATTYPLAQGACIRIDGEVARLRVIFARSQEDTPEKGQQIDEETRRRAKLRLTSTNIAQVLTLVADALDVEGL